MMLYAGTSSAKAPKTNDKLLSEKQTTFVVMSEN